MQFLVSKDKRRKEVKNESKVRTNVHIYNHLPEELEGISLTYDAYTIQDDGYGETIYDIEAEANIPYTIEHKEIDISGEVEGEPDINEYLEIPAGKSVIMVVKAKTLTSIETKEVSNYVTVEANKTITSNIVSFTIVSPYENEYQEDEEKELFSISGIAWLDENKNGKRDEITKKDIIILIVLTAISIVSSIFTYDGFLSLFIVFATMLYTYSVWQKKTNVYKFCGIPIGIMLITYNLYIKSLFGIILETILMVSSTTGYILEIIRKRKDKVNV